MVKRSQNMSKSVGKWKKLALKLGWDEAQCTPANLEALRSYCESKNLRYINFAITDTVSSSGGELASIVPNTVSRRAETEITEMATEGLDQVQLEPSRTLQHQLGESQTSGQAGGDDGAAFTPARPRCARATAAASPTPSRRTPRSNAGEHPHRHIVEDAVNLDGRAGTTNTRSGVFSIPAAVAAFITPDISKFYNANGQTVTQRFPLLMAQVAELVQYPALAHQIIEFLYKELFECSNTLSNKEAQIRLALDEFIKSATDSLNLMATLQEKVKESCVVYETIAPAPDSGEDEGLWKDGNASIGVGGATHPRINLELMRLSGPSLKGPSSTPTQLFRLDIKVEGSFLDRNMKILQKGIYFFRVEAPALLNTVYDDDSKSIEQALRNTTSGKTHNLDFQVILEAANATRRHQGESQLKMDSSILCSVGRGCVLLTRPQMLEGLKQFDAEVATKLAWALKDKVDAEHVLTNTSEWKGLTKRAAEDEIAGPAANRQRLGNNAMSNSQATIIAEDNAQNI